LYSAHVATPANSLCGQEREPTHIVAEKSHLERKHQKRVQIEIWKKTMINQLQSHPETVSASSLRQFIACGPSRARPGAARLRARGSPLIGASSEPLVVGMVEGLGRVVSNSVKGRRYVLRILLPGDTFGLFMQDPSEQILEAITDVKFAVRPYGEIMRRLSNDAGFYSEMIALVAREQAEAREHLEVITLGTAEVRLAWFLLKLLARSGVQDRIPLPLGRQDIADHLGLALETTSRMFTRFKERGWLHEDQRTRILTVLDHRRLNQLATDY
jgi:CRP-like cAMP-binding protein